DSTAPVGQAQGAPRASEPVVAPISENFDATGGEDAIKRALNSAILQRPADANFTRPLGAEEIAERKRATAPLPPQGPARPTSKPLKPGVRHPTDRGHQ
ncbi:MAG: hypothetical protein KBG84_07825, partial [Planctomycetes bacterium]|nr:hypothetical protein [Planctomycetota bacterium]